MARGSSPARRRRAGRRTETTGRRALRLAGRVSLVLAAVVGAYFAVCAELLLAYRWIDPPTTGVQLQRRLAGWRSPRPYRKVYLPVPAEHVSRHLLRAVVAAEDGRFYEHRGVDWKAIEDAIEDTRRGRRRGGSTISQQLAKNLFLTTHSTWARKALELPLTWLTEALLGKQRILELYVNVVEWGPDGMFGVEAAARHHYGVSAAALGREQAARLAACLPAPRRRAPRSMDRYSAIIEERMRRRGW